MSLLPHGTKIFLCTRVTDMRLGFNGFIGLTQSLLNHDPLSGHLFVFVNRRADYAKVLYFARGGYCLWAKRLEQGCFAKISNDDGIVVLNDTQFMMWIDGIGLEQRRQQKRFLKTPHFKDSAAVDEVKSAA